MGKSAVAVSHQTHRTAFAYPPGCPGVTRDLVHCVRYS